MRYRAGRPRPRVWAQDISWLSELSLEKALIEIRKATDAHGLKIQIKPTHVIWPDDVVLQSSSHPVWPFYRDRR